MFAIQPALDSAEPGTYQTPTLPGNFGCIKRALVKTQRNEVEVIHLQTPNGWHSVICQSIRMTANHMVLLALTLSQNFGLI